MNRPDLCEDGRTLFVGLVPPAPGGASIVARNLLQCFSRESVVVATAANRDRSEMNREPENRTFEILRSFPYSRGINNRLFRLQTPLAARRLARLARKVDARVIIGSHPTRHLLEISRLAAVRTKIPWIAYLHDTFAEATAGLPDAERLRRVQEAVFAESSHILVMSEGMSDLYRRKHGGLKTTPLEHIYPLPIRDELPAPPKERKIFWAGNVYVINACSFSRVAKAARKAGMPVSMTSPKSLTTIGAMGIDTSSIERAYYPDWSEYLSALSEHEILLLALDWPDESDMHRDELATIFPTKTPEYLASGRPILVHCPEDYFLARFFRDHDCGTVVSERSVEAVCEAIGRIRGGGPEIRKRSLNGLEAMDRFRPERIARRLKTVVDAVSKVHWGEKVDIEPELRDA